MRILGISAYYHDSAACLVIDGTIVAAAQEERFNRLKHYPGFPAEAIKYCLKQVSIKLSDIDYIVFYEKPFTKFERLVDTYLAYAPSGLKSFIQAMLAMVADKKLLMSKLITDEFKTAFPSVEKLPKVLFSSHHESHAASAFFPSPYERAAVLCMDGVGEWSTTTAWLGEGNRLKPLWEIRFPHSVGLLYSAFTYFTGFKVNSGEYKVMGLAPYGKPTFKQKIYDNLIDVKEDGTFRLNMDYFNYPAGFTMTNAKFSELFGIPVRPAEDELQQVHMDLARSVQEVTEEIMLRIARTLNKETGAENLCLAGGVALNCVGNGRILREGPFKGIWIQPAAGDAGGAIGAALTCWHQYLNKERHPDGKNDSMRGSYLGPSYTNEDVEAFLKSINAKYTKYDDSELYDVVADEMAKEKVVGWMAGRMEFGPRALGGRSIIGDARSSKMQSVMNLKIKHRESFRPFAPSVLEEKVSDYFDLNSESPYMLLVAPVKESRRKSLTAEQKSLHGVNYIEYLKVPKSDIPAITHVDYSARVQTVSEKTNPRYYKLIKAFEKKTGYGVIVNTSFNVRSEPIVMTPADAFKVFVNTEMDVLVVENYVLRKEDYSDWKKTEYWKEYELD